MYPHPKDVLDALNTQVQATTLSPDTKLLVVFGYPRSDIGKGTLVSHMLALLDDANVVKFDGILNTNLDGRFTQANHDDFASYSGQNPAQPITEYNHLLGGSLLRDFVTEFGETEERLTVSPHLDQFFRLRLQQQWHALGRPQHLILEMGGSPDDAEASYAVATVRQLKAEMGTNCQVVLLTEMAHHNQFAKSRTASRGVHELLMRGIVPDALVVREPLLEQPVSSEQRLGFELQLQERIAERTGQAFNKIVSMPYFSQAELASVYRGFVKLNVLPILKPQRHSSILIASTDQPEIEEWEILLGHHIKLTTDVKLQLEFKEDPESLRRNARARARGFSRASGLPAIAGTVGLHIDKLGGKPGVGVRSWGGTMPEASTNAELYSYLQKQVGTIDDPTCYLERCVTLALPSGEEYNFTYRNHGYIDQDILSRPYRPGHYPIGLVFRYAQTGATWSEMSRLERRQVRSTVVDQILDWMNRFLDVT